MQGNLGQEQDKEIAPRQDPCPRANYALKTNFLIRRK